MAPLRVHPPHPPAPRLPEVTPDHIPTVGCGPKPKTNGRKREKRRSGLIFALLERKADTPLTSCSNKGRQKTLVWELRLQYL